VTSRRITHYRHGGTAVYGGTAACTERIRPPHLSEDPELTNCGNCTRTRAYRVAARPRPVVVPAVPDPDAVAHPADRAVLTEWMRRAG
jgi:hypothetical protein